MVSVAAVRGVGEYAPHRDLSPFSSFVKYSEQDR